MTTGEKLRGVRSSVSQSSANPKEWSAFFTLDLMSERGPNEAFPMAPRPTEVSIRFDFDPPRTQCRMGEHPIPNLTADDFIEWTFEEVQRKGSVHRCGGKLAPSGSPYYPRDLAADLVADGQPAQAHGMVQAFRCDKCGETVERF